MKKLNKKEIEENFGAEESPSLTIGEFLNENFKLTKTCERECSIDKCLLSERPDYLCHISGLKVIKIAGDNDQYRIKHANNGEIENFKIKYGLM